ncbi:TetR family transcriptional regulator [Zhihengliuella sp.]|uniref:TetR/AcrR family transcriptional regulator n=1 Tax=Zhihengliuella sp. TaxID=1954483 RepID=UPI0028120E84|nr:TetR family transcriptional regulator [Zhihengliuella sp.]
MAAEQDVTTRARIRDAAIEQIARRGYSVSVRSIAQAAGVSVGLINHHFGSKEGLREACDGHVLELILTAKRESVAGGALASLAAMSRIEEYAVPVAYCLRCLQAGGSAAARLIDHFVSDARVWIADGVASGLLKPSLDEEARARTLTVMGFGSALLALTLYTADGGDEFSPERLSDFLNHYIAEHGLPMVELYTHGVYAGTDTLDAYLEATGRADQGRTAAAAADPTTSPGGASTAGATAASPQED